MIKKLVQKAGMSDEDIPSSSSSSSSSLPSAFAIPTVGGADSWRMSALQEVLGLRSWAGIAHPNLLPEPETQPLDLPPPPPPPSAGHDSTTEAGGTSSAAINQNNNNNNSNNRGSSVSSLSKNYALLQRSDGRYTVLNKAAGRGYIALSVDHQPKVILDDQGNLGVGVYSPHARLHVKVKKKNNKAKVMTL